MQSVRYLNLGSITNNTLRRSFKPMSSSFLQNPKSFIEQDLQNVQEEFINFQDQREESV